MERISAKYFIETPLAIDVAAEVLAGEQSSGTFVSVPGETKQLKERFAARIESISPLASVQRASLPGADTHEGPYRRAHIEVSWSVENFGYNLPVMISTLQGNLYELRQFTGLKLLDFEVPNSFARHFSGATFGIQGSRKLIGVNNKNRPLIGTIIKPSIGLTPEETASLVTSLVETGIDFIKDDELLSSSANSPFETRVDAVMRIINNYADKTGKKVMYAFNISSDMDTMLERYEKIVASGGTCAMVSLNSVGVSATKKICEQKQLAIHGHRNGWGMLNRHAALGIGFPAYQKIWRLAGVDQIHVNGLQNKFWEPDESVIQSIKSCLKPMLGGYSILPVISSGQWGGQAPETYQKTGTTDLLYLAGGGIMAHPEGPAGGVKALKQAWNAAVRGQSVEEAARQYPEFAKSVEKFGNQ